MYVSVKFIKMYLIKTIFLALSLVVLVNAGATDYDSLEKASPIFSGKLYKQLSNSKDNILISPISLQTALALVQVGAKGTTLDQMSQVLSLPFNKTELIIAFSQWHNLLQTTAITINSANKIYVRNDIKLLDYYKSLTKYFNAEIENVDLTKDSVGLINKWVADKTNNKIKEIVKEGDITGDTVIMIFNALYFNGAWENPFDPQVTQKRPFYANGVDEVQTDMMVQIGRYNISNNLELKASFLELPYKGGDFVMTLVLPHDRTGLAKLEENIDKVLVERTTEAGAVIQIPKFKIEQEVDFVEVLKKLGLKSLFRRPNLSAMTLSRTQLAIDKIVQKTYLDVSELGTEAAAATGISVEDRFGHETEHRFIADHPFLFIIKHKSTNIIEFLGRYNGP